MAKRKKDDLKWVKETLNLSNNHNWSSKPGCKVFVAGRGAVRFDVPGDWHFEPKEKSFRFTDKKPPDEDCGLEVSFNLLPPEADFSSFPLGATLKKIAKDDSRNVIEFGEVVHIKRQTAKIVWLELKFIDAEENREAYSRICVGLGSGVQCLITFDYWVDDADRLVPVWDTVLETLVLGLFIRDPRTGFAMPD
jgi:hypothetical protein